MASRYTLILTLGLFFIYATISLENIFRASGNTFTPMVIIVITLSLNAILDPLFIFGWFGFPELGMPGGALASVISHIIGIVLFYLKIPQLNIRFKIITQSFRQNSYEILRIGTPIGLLGAVFSAIYIVLSKNIAWFGTVPMAAISICHRIEGIPFFVAFGFSTAVSTLVGQNLGANKSERAVKSANLSLSYSAVFLFLTSIMFILFGKQMLGFFIENKAVIDEGYRYLFAISVFEVFLAAEITLEGVFTGAGDTKPPFLISIPLTLLRIPLAWLFSIKFGYGVVAIWWVISFSTFLKGVMFFIWYKRGKWQYKTVY